MSKVSTNWKTIKQTPLIKNRFVEMWEDEVLNPEGRTMFWYVRRNGDFSVIIPLENDWTYLVEQYRYPVKSLT